MQATALKGIGHGGDGEEAAAQIEALNVDWNYGWSSRVQSVTEGFVPMIWGADQIDRAVGHVLRELPQTKATHLLGFNEPDHRDQADMSVDKALELWPKLESTGLRLGSPATVKPNSPWLADFMAKARLKGRRVDFMTMHSYGWPNADDFLRKVRELHEKYGKPIWVTEYAVADFRATSKAMNRYTTAQVRDFMRETVEGMRTMPYVERFAWKTRTVNDPKMWVSALYQEDGSLTSRGRLYATL